MSGACLYMFGHLWGMNNGILSAAIEMDKARLCP